jgi:apolipoprotein N-acyltransferase
MTGIKSPWTRAAGAVLSGCLLALAGSLHPWWAVAWIASIPVLVAAFGGSGRSAFGLGLLAGLVGGVSILGYYAAVATWPVALAIVALQALLYAGGVRFAWGTRARLPAGIAVFAFPAWFAAFDLVVATWSPNGTAGSLAYSQMNFPVALQVASLGGAPAITFVLGLFSSAVAHAIAARDAPRRTRLALIPAFGMVCIALVYGVWRIASAPADPTIAVALAALDQEQALPDDWRASVDAYRPLLAQARAGHVELMVLPEEISVASIADLPAIEAELGRYARDSRLSIAVGLRVADAGSLRNVLLLVTADGGAMTYDKQHLVPGFEIPKITPGPGPALIATVAGIRLGGAICKDFDFVDVGRSLGRGGAALVVAPAWDFGQDGWLHGRMAMLRAVEGGFTLVRSAREGTMTVSDRFGRVLAEASSGPRAPLLMARAPVPGSGATVYARVGDLFGWCCVGLVLLLVALGSGRWSRAWRS